MTLPTTAAPGRTTGLRLTNDELAMVKHHADAEARSTAAWLHLRILEALAERTK